ncbi:MAG: S-layer homology domain-containing protein [Elainellaceae cyanobacterium]
MFAKRSIVLMGLLGLTVPLAACSGGSFGESLRRSLAADPQLENNPTVFGENAETSADGRCPEAILAELPNDFPDGICYPDAEFLETNQSAALSANRSAAEPPSRQTRWTTPDSPEQVQQFYLQLFEQQNWEIAQRPSPTSTSTQNSTGDLEAVREGVRVTLQFDSAVQDIQADASSGDRSSPDAPDDLASENGSTGSESAPTEFTLAYSRSQVTPASALSDSPVSERSQSAADSPSSSSAENLNVPANSRASQTFSDINDAPEELRPYIEDLAQLGVLTSSVSDASDGSSSNTFNPTQTVTRREFARWLFTANNTLYTDQPAKRIRPATDSVQPAFQDIPRSDPDFDVIQGLAEAGLIPSPLSGDSTTVNFRPDAPLTRQDMLLWKLPLDVRRSLPTATVDAVQQTWGFQDAARIDPKSLKAVLADFQNGDMANIRRAFGYTTLFQPQKPVTRAEAAAVLWYFGYQGEGLSAQEVVQPSRQADSAPSD